jgi:DNA-binding NarL/FixJ family response regulator
MAVGSKYTANQVRGLPLWPSSRYLSLKRRGVALSMRTEGVPARLLIADDHAMVREGMRSMLANEPDLQIVGEAKDGEEVLKLCRRFRPELVLMDVRMPKMDGLQATRAIKEISPQTAILVVSTYENQEYLLEAIKAGAAGYILKEATKGQLLSAVRTVLAGETLLNQELAMRVIRNLIDEQQFSNQGYADVPPSSSGRPSDERAGPSPLEVLSPRELDVLRLIARGRTNQQISEDLLVSVSTVKKHVHQIIAKLGVSDRTQAAISAIQFDLEHPKRNR